jgi:type II secretory pathway component PulF
MAIFQFLATTDNKEHHMETGSVIARDKIDAYDKLRKNNLTLVKLKKLNGFDAFLKSFHPDIR